MLALITCTADTFLEHALRRRTWGIITASPGTHRPSQGSALHVSNALCEPPIIQPEALALKTLTEDTPNAHVQEVNASTIASKVSGKELHHSYSRSMWIFPSLLAQCYFQGGTRPLEILNYIRGAAKIKGPQQRVTEGSRGLCESQPPGRSAVSACQPGAPHTTARHGRAAQGCATAHVCWHTVTKPLLSSPRCDCPH